jgi:hypothetical protein
VSVILFHQQQRKKYYTVRLHVVVSNSFGLVVEILNISEFEVTNTIMGKHLSGLLFKK